MGGTAGEQIHHALALEGCKAADQIAIAGMPAGQMALDRGLKVNRCFPSIGRCFLKQSQPCLDPLGESPLQGGVSQQREQRGRGAHGQLGLLLWISCGCLQGLQQGEVALDQGLKEPVLFQGIGRRRPHIGKVGMENKSQCSAIHAPSSTVA